MITLALFRLKLLIKQKLIWGMILAAAAIFPFALFMAFSSYVRPDKIYWDLSLSFCFIVGVLLSAYLGTHLFQDETQRKTLSFVLTLKATRKEWIFANWMGLASVIAISVMAWTVLLTISAYLGYGQIPPAILFQAQVFLLFESLLIIAVSLWTSLYLKPLLSWFAVLSMIALLHSKTYLEVLVVESDFTGVSKLLYNSVLFVLNFLPPLEWWDIRIFVGFHDVISVDQFFLMTALTAAWTYIFLFLAQTKLETMDL